MSKHNYPTVLVHGLLGIDEGPYNYINLVYRYFGGFRGDLTKAMRARGYEFYDPGLGPFTPVWDRVCDLYAYLVGGTVDYGKAHSERYGHARYGRTYEGVLKDWGTPGNHEKINILGYSFGGPTVNLLNGLLMHGSEEERAVTPEDELSPLFTGG
ncbi:MAG: lipase, partial [Bacteroidales bacterium]|nr:lipase [Bacteroidales bacterium]